MWQVLITPFANLKYLKETFSLKHANRENYLIKVPWKKLMHINNINKLSYLFLLTWYNYLELFYAEWVNTIIAAGLAANK